MYHIIVNPASRSGKGIHVWKNIIFPMLEDRGIKFQVYFSEKNGDATHLAKRLLREHSQRPLPVIILGGDGTINEFLQGTEDLSQFALGYIPTGSSNDLARDLHISTDPRTAMQHILDAKETTPMDLGTVTLADGTTYHFAVSCGIGYDARVCQESNQSRFKHILNTVKLGKLTYLVIALKNLITSKMVTCTITIDDREPIEAKKMLFSVGMIHRFEGGGFMFCPAADYRDGLIDLCSAGNIPRLIIPFLLPTAFFGKHLLFRNINAYRGKYITIESPIDLWLHTDGEARIRTRKITLSCRQHALNIYL